MAKKLNSLIKLDKPLVVFDLETTGLVISMDKIIAIAYVKIMPDGTMPKDQMFINPGMEVSQEAVEIHGITNEFLADKPAFKDKARELWEIFNDCDYGGFNVINFDLPILRREFLRVGLDFDYSAAKIIDSKTIYHYMEPRTLSAAYKYYCGKEHHDSHNALADVEATVEILHKQLEKYEAVRDWQFVYKIHHSSSDRYVDNERRFYWRDGKAYFAFSKYKDRALAEVARVDAGFLRWILTADFSDETKNIVKNALDGIFPKREEERENEE